MSFGDSQQPHNQFHIA
jgi:hypothetical protein